MTHTPECDFDVVVPTIGRPTLQGLLDALARQPAPYPRRILLVDDRASPSTALLEPELLAGACQRVVVLPGPARGPAGARNVGWRASTAQWVEFLDDDVLPGPCWSRALAADLAGLAPTVAGIQGRVRVPVPGHRAPTDWERHVAGLEHARFATADMAYRRAALVAAGGFDERFRRAYREDADLALRLRRAGWSIEWGRRNVLHPVRPVGPMVSLRLQAGNADDVLMRALHGRDWRRDAGASRGRIRRHGIVVGCAVGACLFSLRGPRIAARIAALGWVAASGELAFARIAPGPRTPREVARMLATTLPMPFFATGFRAAGWARVARMAGAHGTSALPAQAPRQATLTDIGPRRASLDAVFLDRDGTLIEDVPYNGDPARVHPRPGALGALNALRDAGVRLAVVSNQSGVGLGTLTVEQVHAVNRRVEELLGPLGLWMICMHAPDDGCECRKPRPGLIISALRQLAVSPERCAMIGDIGADVQAALAAGVRPVLVPTHRTLPAEVRAAPEVAGDLEAAVTMLVGPQHHARRIQSDGFSRSCLISGESDLRSGSDDADGR